MHSQSTIKQGNDTSSPSNQYSTDNRTNCNSQKEHALNISKTNCSFFGICAIGDIGICGCSSSCKRAKTTIEKGTDKEKFQTQYSPVFSHQDYYDIVQHGST